MSAAASLGNLLSWLVQVSVIATLGALLPTLLRIRHPRSQLAYYHTILVLCLALPLIQPWQHPLVMVSTPIVQSRGATAGISWAGLILGIIALGTVAKLLWLGAGLWQLRRYRRSAIPLYPIPQSIREARIYTGADAVFCISKDVAGPATLGYFDPVVLLPPSFLSLDEDAQRSVACHELLHVWRNDWLITVVEEVASSLLWFHPAVWWLIARAKLTREQVVDAEVVRMTAPGPYIEALLSMAVVSKGRLALPTAPFFTEGHLVHRMRSLLASPRRSLARLCVSYACMALVLLLAGWTVLILFPLSGEALAVTPPLQRLPLKLIAPSQIARGFNVQVPPPNGETRDVFYFMHGEAGNATQGSGVLHFEVAPPPPPPPPGMAFRMLSPGVRILRPGQIATPEEIQGFIASFPERSLVEVIQGEDGTVQKVMVTARRLANAADTIRFGNPSRPAGQAPAGPAIPDDSAGAADRVH